MPAVQVRIDPAALSGALRGPDSALRQRLRADGERIRQGARAACPRSDRSDSEHVQDAIVLRDRDRGSDPGVAVGIWAPEGRVGRAYWLHEGTRPHRIAAVNARALAFNWPKVGALTFVPRAGGQRTGYRPDGTFVIGKGYVDHPGTRPVPFLWLGARAAGFNV